MFSGMISSLYHRAGIQYLLILDIIFLIAHTLFHYHLMGVSSEITTGDS